MVILESDICSFLSHVQAKRYEAAYEKLQFMLYAHDANMCCSARRQLTDLLKSAAMELLKCMKIYSVEENLLLLKFLKSCFQSTFDAESRLVIIYEELLLRDSVCVDKRYLGVTDDEWMCFARDCLQHGFYHNAAKAYDMIISRVRSLKLAQDTMKVILEEVTKEKQFALQLADRTSGGILLKERKDPKCNLCGKGGYIFSRCYKKKTNPSKENQSKGVEVKDGVSSSKCKYKKDKSKERKR
ncbi:hypothetical protein O6H91_17G027300 [Diphasiastrum complanatum]|uniref:Uncharacterized protein n=1 Tax=Diphasiastrum complanatum TaxID=34168 RepID=A0ACC2B596_DIPCM|nr:hypothetical protein O6H91_17G027300 [Diphasiastrum complanatum]